MVGSDFLFSTRGLQAIGNRKGLVTDVTQLTQLTQERENTWLLYIQPHPPVKP